MTQSISTGAMKLRAFISENGMLQGKLAALSGVSQAYLSQIISGKRVPSLPVAGRICSATGGAVAVEDWVSLGGVRSAA